MQKIYLKHLVAASVLLTVESSRVQVICYLKDDVTGQTDKRTDTRPMLHA